MSYAQHGVSFALDKIGQNITREMVIEHRWPGFDFCIGLVCQHPEAGLVQITGGQFFSNGRISNWWWYRRLIEDESGLYHVHIPRNAIGGPKSMRCRLESEERSGYGWRIDSGEVA